MAMRLLVVEDDSAERAVLQEALQSGKGPQFEITEAADLPTALAQLDEGAFAAIILDLGLPGHEPAEVLFQILEHGGDAAVLVYSDKQTADLGVAAVDAGAHAHVRKETGPKVLIHQLGMALLRRFSGREDAADDPDASAILRMVGSG